jgi:hypothetical protein
MINQLQLTIQKISKFNYILLNIIIYFYSEEKKNKIKQNYIQKVNEKNILTIIRIRNYE